MVLQAEKALLAAISAKALRFVYSTGIGYRLERRPHPSGQGHVRVERDGRLVIVMDRLAGKA
jgi:hypothetical protein